MSSEIVSRARTGRSPGIVDRIARSVLTGRLSGLTRGEISIDDGQTVNRFGERDDLHCSIRVHRPRFFREAVLGGKLSVAETYVRGDWDCDNLTSLFRLFIRNTDTSRALDRGLARVAGTAHRMFHWLRDNTPSGSRKNIGAHYDLGNEFFKLWLDDTLAYSSGIFNSAESTLFEASVEKIDRCCRKLDLKTGDHLLEIGSGWGGMAVHAASEYGCRVTTTTISQEQFDATQDRVESMGLEDRVRLLKKDYRDLTGRFDKLVSIEMIEAVGHRYLDTYFRKCSELLKPDGSMVVQAIVMPESRYAQYTQNVDFIQRYIFPGGCLPSMAAILKSVGRTTDLRFVHAEDFAPHYAETLRRWRKTFVERLDDVRKLGYSNEFIRLWTYYLCYCEAAFEERHIGVMQIQFDKSRCRRDPIRIGTRAAERMLPNAGAMSADSSESSESLCEAGV
jgi:cyclopropane-fatty-acyl-phospholipid synthase